jgi:hypothetical protein
MKTLPERFGWALLACALALFAPRVDAQDVVDAAALRTAVAT